ncbi:MAG: hypothetical protein JKY09_08320 [Crocinitomicaceae bacterium]|nr:hypothetical protein [Crocinitomicaceae bacterium]
MKLGKLLLGATLIFATVATAQDDPERECKRMRYLAGEALKVQNYHEASMYYLKGEQICGGYEADNWARLLGSLRKTINGEKDEKIRKNYTDTLLAAYTRAEAAGAYDKKDDLVRGYYTLQGSTPDNVAADALFLSGIEAGGTAIQEMYISHYYYNLYVMYYGEKDAEKKSVLKSRLIKDYFKLSKLITDANFSIKAQENLTAYFNNIVQSCDDLLPDLKGFMSSFSQDPEIKKAAVTNFINLLELKGCTSSTEYFELIDTLIDIDPTSFEAQMMKAKALGAKKDHRGAIAAYKAAKEVASDEGSKQEIQYEIARTQLTMGSYTAAYKTAMTVKGDLRGKALIVAGQAVGKNANNCGDSTFERKCNNIYAVQLLQQGRALGASAGNAIGSFKTRYPTESEIFENGSPSSVSLTCYGVSVNPKG